MLTIFSGWQQTHKRYKYLLPWRHHHTKGEQLRRAHKQVKANPRLRSVPPWRSGPPWRYAQTRTRYGVPDLTNLHWHTYGVILKTWFWLVKAGECPQQYVPYTESGITPQECSLLPWHLRNLCLEIRCCETRCLDFVSNEGLRMVFDDDNIPRSHRNFPNNWPEMKGFYCPQREK